MNLSAVDRMLIAMANNADRLKAPETTDQQREKLTIEIFALHNATNIQYLKGDAYKAFRRAAIERFGLDPLSPADNDAAASIDLDPNDPFLVKWARIGEQIKNNTSLAYDKDGNRIVAN